MADYPLTVTVDEDNSDGFCVAHGFDAEQALERAGAVDVQPKDDRFEIVLIDKSYRAGE